MLHALRNHPFATSLLVLLLYAMWFSGQVLFAVPDPGQHGVSGVDGGIDQWKNQAVLATAFVVILSLLGWWRNIGFGTLNRGGLKFLLLPVMYISVILVAAMQSAGSSSWLLGSTSPQQFLALALVMLGVGFTEESMFRGILYYGFSVRFSSLVAATSTALIFGVFHYQNLFLGAPLGETSYQVLHAAAAGFMYVALRLRIGALWPVMLFHAFWDFCLFNRDTLIQNVAPTEPAAGAMAVSPLLNVAMQIVPALTYGAFVYWRWSVYRREHEAAAG